MTMDRYLKGGVRLTALLLGIEFGCAVAVLHGQPRDATVPHTTLTAEGRSEIVPYDRDAWGSWRTVDGCSTRERVLLRDNVADDPTKTCTTRRGRWVSPYSGDVLLDVSDVQIEHIVSVREAHLSGGWQWNRTERRTFYNDLTNLIAVESALNQAKSGWDATRWLPPANACMFARVTVEIKQRYELSMDVEEFHALRGALATCTATREDWGGYPAR
jgi:hypothetical protein